MGGHDAELILIAGVLLAAGIAGALLADRARIPGLLLFLALGMLAGSEGIGGIEFDDAELTRLLGTIALVLILFEGGLTSGWREIRPVLACSDSTTVVLSTTTACGPKNHCTHLKIATGVSRMVSIAARTRNPTKNREPNTRGR